MLEDRLGVNFGKLSGIGDRLQNLRQLVGGANTIHGG